MFFTCLLHTFYQTGPPQYCSRTVYENATPELLRDFYWDDEFRLKWDDMLIHAQTREECPTTGTMIVHWVRKVKKGPYKPHGLIQQVNYTAMPTRWSHVSPKIL